MQIRPATSADLFNAADIDGTIDSTHYLHVDKSGSGVGVRWLVEERPLRERLVASNPLTDDQQFVLKQIVTGVDEGIALYAEHDGQPAALAIAMIEAERGVLAIKEIRVDSDFR